MDATDEIIERLYSSTRRGFRAMGNKSRPPRNINMTYGIL